MALLKDCGYSEWQAGLHIVGLSLHMRSRSAVATNRAGKSSLPPHEMPWTYSTVAGRGRRNKRVSNRGADRRQGALCS